jgi:hypothetical protein
MENACNRRARPTLGGVANAFDHPLVEPLLGLIYREGVHPGATNCLRCLARRKESPATVRELAMAVTEALLYPESADVPPSNFWMQTAGLDMTCRMQYLELTLRALRPALLAEEDATGWSTPANYPVPVAPLQMG